MSLAVLVNNKTKSIASASEETKRYRLSFNGLTVLIFRRAEWRNGSLAGTGQWDERAGIDSRRS